MPPHINSYIYSILRLFQNYRKPQMKAAKNLANLRVKKLLPNRHPEVVIARRNFIQKSNKFIKKRNEIATRFGEDPVVVELDLQSIFLPAIRALTPSPTRKRRRTSSPRSPNVSH